MGPMLTSNAKPLELTDEQLSFIMEILKPIEAPERAAFLEALAIRLRQEAVVGDGNQYRISRELLRAGFFHAPIISTPTTGRRSKLNDGPPIGLAAISGR